MMPSSSAESLSEGMLAQPLERAESPDLASVRVSGLVLDLLIVVLIIGFTLALLPGLNRWPPLINDEGREANLFWAASGADPTATRMNAHRGFATWGNGGIQGATAAIIYRLGGVGVFQSRLTSLIWAGGLLLATFFLGRYYWGRAAGLAAIVLLSVSDAFLVSSHTLRPDVQVITLVLTAVLLTEIAVSRRQPLWAVLAGYLLGLAFDVHPNAVGLMPLVGLVLLVRQGWGFWRERQVWMLAAGLVLAAIQYLLFRFVPDPGGFLAGLQYWVGVDKQPPAGRVAGVGGIVNSVLAEIARYQDYFGEEPLEVAMVLAGIVGGVWWAIRGDRGSRVLLLGLVAAFIFFVVAVSTKSKYYMLLTYPIYALLVGRLIDLAAFNRWVTVRGQQLVATVSATRLPVLGSLIFVGLTALMVYVPLKGEDRAWDNYIRARRYRAGQEYLQLTDRLDALAGPGARILAPPLYWIGLKSHPYTDIYVYERLQRQMDMSVAQFLDETRPDFVITDAKIATDKRVEKLLYNELDARATRELIVRHKNYGDVAVYRLDWSNAGQAAIVNPGGSD